MDLQVFKSINAVQAALVKEGIAKDRCNKQQGYNFRGIDDIYNTLSGLLADNGLCILPEVIEREQVERVTQKGGVLFYTTVKVKYTIVASADGSQFVTATYGEAMDSADKSTNKAMSAAYKYMCLQVFCIPTQGDNDADATTPDPVQPTIEDRINHFKKILGEATLEKLNSENYKKKFNDFCKEIGPERADELTKLHNERILALMGETA